MTDFYAEGSGPEFKPGHCQHLPPHPTVFYGEPTVWYLAICEECATARGPDSRALPMPFGTAAQRQTWIDGHSEVHKNIKLALEVRP